LRKPFKAAELSDGVHLVLAAGEDLVAVGLMSGVPDELVLGGVEDVVQGDGDIGRTEAGGEVAAELGDVSRMKRASRRRLEGAARS